MIIKYNVTLLLLIFCCRFSFADTYIWEDYDDFSGSTLDTSKWGTMYLGGGIEPHVTDGKLVLSGGVGNPSASKVVKTGWAEIFKGDDGGQAWIYAKGTEVYGIEAEFIIPSAASSMSGLQLGIASLNPLSYAIVELNAEPNSASQYSQGFGFYHLLNGSETEKFGSTQRDITHKLGATLMDGRLKLFVDGEVKYEADSETFNTDMFFLNGFNDYQAQGLAFELNADNVRVLRQTTTTSLDGSIFSLSSTDGVSETMSFENGTFTSSFVDSQKSTTITSNQSYILDSMSSNSWKITLNDGDVYSFDSSAGTGTLTDYENGVMDTSGSWNFTYIRNTWEDYEDFSGSTLDTTKWDLSQWDGGIVPALEGSRLKFSGQANSSSSVNIATSAMLASSSNVSVGSSSSTSPHSILEFKESQNLKGIELTFSIPSGVPNQMSFGLYAIAYQTMFNSGGDSEESAIRFNFDLWADNSLAATLEFDAKEPTTGIEQGIDKSISFDSSYRVSFIRGDSQISFYRDGELVGEFPYSDVGEYFIVRAMNQINQTFTTYLDNVRVLRRSTTTTQPDPVTVVSDPNGQAVVVQVGNEYQWNSTLDGVTLWSVSESERDGKWSALTAKFSGGNLLYGFEFKDDVADTGNNKVTYQIDENGYIKSLEDDGDYQYYNPVSVENGVVGTIENDQGVDSVANNGINQVDQWFFTTRAAAEEYYYSKVNPKDWMWFDQYPWVYSNELQEWLYFYSSGGTLMYWSNKGQAWRQFN